MPLEAASTPLIATTPWYEKSSWHRPALVLLAVVILIEGYVSIVHRENDFLFHRNLGEAFLQGEPYANSGDWYPVGRVMLNGMIASVPHRVARAISYLLAVGALCGIFFIWRELANLSGVVSRTASLSAALVTAGMLFPFILRDLDECGLQLFLLFFLSCGAWSVLRGKNLQAGCWLGLAATFKITPLICLPFLIYKRRWKAAGWMAVFIVGWNLMPALFVGWDTTIRCNQAWIARMALSSKVVDPALNAVEVPKPQNLSLAGTVGRYLRTYPVGHPLNVDHPAFVQFGTLEPEQANRVFKAFLLTLAGLLAWRFRKAWPRYYVLNGQLTAAAKEPDDTTSAAGPEWAAVCLLCALLSPICWKQHLVVVLPCLFLAVRGGMAAGGHTRGRLIALVTIALVVICCRHAAVGRMMSIALLSYKFDTMAMMLTMFLALTLPTPARRATAVLKEIEPKRPGLARAA